MAVRFAALFAAALLTSTAFAQTKSFTILHSNDQHGHLLPFSYPDRISPKEDVAKLSVRKDIGGIARRASLVKQIKSETKNCWLIDAGDCMDGSPFSVEFFAQADYAAMNAVGYDFGVFGNHDFNMTVAQFDALKKSVGFPLVLANVTEKKSEKTILPPYVIKEWDGVKVALFGLVTGSTRTYTAAKAAYKVSDPIAVAAELVPKLRQQADLVIGITHIGLDEDRQLARAVPGIDILVGAHSHTRLPNGVKEGQTIILQDHQWVGELGRLDFTLTKNASGKWALDQWKERLLPVTRALPEDPKVAAVVASYWDKIKAKYSTVIGQATAEFTDTYDMDRDPTNYYLVADAVASELGTVDFDLENRAGVRGPLLQGPITYGDLVGMDPFENAVYTFAIRGRDLKKLIVSTRPLTSAGLRYVLKKSGRRWTLESATVGGKPIDDDTLYKGATAAYYFTSTVRRVALEGVDTGKTRRSLIEAYIKKHTPLKPTEDKRNDFSGADPAGF